MDDVTRTSLGTGGSGPVSLDAAQARFLPGAIVAGRYRIVGRLGAGGMGEVYRADDLRLGQPLALKFLPSGFAGDPRRLEAFRAEVRLAREVTHPNVCRVHDLGEVEGEIFLSMEYVDGEDLASLLRRIGRVPQDKAIELARQICGGLAAAHERGVLHRDLKPANIMIDGRGRARIMDFGLAAVSGTVRREDVRSGTPNYMAPEAFEGREVTVRSDIYSLGLVLYELFTGKRAIDARTIAELRERHASGNAVSLPSMHVADLEPAVESTILRCIEPEPAARPASVVAVAASLPGGDPLAAALAAGETPSPELVAEAGGEGALAPRAAWAWLAATLALFAFVLATGPVSTMTAAVPLTRPPAALEDRARELLAAAGYDDVPLDRARGLQYNNQLLDHFDTPSAIAAARPRAIEFWYRQSDAPLQPTNVINEVTTRDPPPVEPGMALVVLDADGRLLALAMPPPDVSPAPPVTAPASAAEAAAPAAEPDWAPLLRAAGFDPEALVEVPSTWTPPYFAETRRAWTGRLPGAADDLRVEAAAYRGKPVSFFVAPPWLTVLRGKPERSSAQHIATIVSVLTLGGAMVGAGVVARRNLRAGRGDRRGAARLAAAALGLSLAANLLRSHAPRSLDQAWDSFVGCSSIALFVTGLIWLVYLALEPLVRRARPHALVSWNRLLAGRWRDPLVGRDVLIGAAYGALLAAVTRIPFLLPEGPLRGTLSPFAESLAPLLGASGAVQTLLSWVISALLLAMLMQFFVAIGTGRRSGGWNIFGYVVFGAISFAVFFVGWADLPLVPRLAFTLVPTLIWSHLFARQGLVAGICAIFVLAWRVPVPTDPGAFYAATAFVMTAFLLALPVIGFRIALAGRPAFGTPA